MPLDRKAFEALASNPHSARKTAKVEIPGYGDVLVQSLTVGELALHEAWFYDKEGKKLPKRVVALRERWAISCCVDDQGRLLFNDEDMPWLKNLPAIVLDAIVARAKALSNADDTPLEDLAGNSVTAPPSGSGCASPSQPADS